MLFWAHDLLHIVSQALCYVGYFSLSAPIFCTFLLKNGGRGGHLLLLLSYCSVIIIFFKDIILWAGAVCLGSSVMFKSLNKSVYLFSRIYFPVVFTYILFIFKYLTGTYLPGTPSVKFLHVRVHASPYIQKIGALLDRSGSVGISGHGSG